MSVRVISVFTEIVSRTLYKIIFSKLNTYIYLMQKNYDQLKIEYSFTDKESKSVRFMCLFLILLFAFVPLAEIVTGFDYIQNSYHSTNSFTCLVGWDFEPLSFKPLN